MRRTVLLPAVLLLAAFAPPKTPVRAVEALPAANVAAPLRDTVKVQLAVPPVRQRAWDDFIAARGASWQALWDAATGVPTRVYGGSLWVPGSSADAFVAESAARGFLAQHAALLAPGMTSADLVLASDHDDGKRRIVGFWQTHGGVRVVGGQVAVWFENDRIYVASSEALPDVDVDTTGASPDDVIVPLVADDRVMGYRLARPVLGDGEILYTDPATGDVLVRRATREYASGTLVYDVPVRWPGGGRADYPAKGAAITVNGSGTTTADDGTLSWSPDSTGTLATSVHGARVVVQNTGDETASEATRNLSIAPAGTARWSEAATDTKDSQLTAFVHVQVAKDFGLGFITDAAARTWLSDPLTAVVNIDDSCNAYWDGTKLNFFAASGDCENTGRIADVIYHEFGHGLHQNLVIDGVGQFPSDFQEGAADFYAALLTGDHGMAYGFDYSEKPLRDLDPVGEEATYPQDVGEVHTTGLIYGGTFWDLWQLAKQTLGDAPGTDLTRQLYIASLQTLSETGSLLVDLLAADDDDGDLSNGTPHECMIRQALGPHGFRTVSVALDVPDIVAGTTTDTTTDVTVAISGQSLTCGTDGIIDLDLTWVPRFDSRSPDPGNVIMTQQPDDTFTGQMPLPDPGDVMEYRVTITYFDGSTTDFPQNLGDPWYQLYRGDLVQLYCTDFETSPFEGDAAWTHAGQPDDLWQWGAPTGQGGDPAEAYSGTHVLGLALDQHNGKYEAGTVADLRMPPVDIGQYSDVRLQFRRWLGVEDAAYDSAKILVNGEQAWQNYDGGGGSNPAIATEDHEWVFRDVAISGHINDHTAQVTFELTADGGFELGGWTLDDVCIVADPDALCGDGTINGIEQCDDGDNNSDEPDACRPNCRRATCGDGVRDSNESCDDGNRENDDGCSILCGYEGSTGCCSTETDPWGALGPMALAGWGLVFVMRRRRTR